MLSDLLHAIGFGLCHQLPERSFSAGGIQVPVCARDTGIYVGFTFVLLVLILRRTDRPRSFPAWWGWLCAALLVAFMGWDGVTSYAGLRDTDNFLRLVTGTGAGGSAAVLVVAMMNDVLWSRSSERRILQSISDGFVWFGSMTLAIVFVLWIAPRLGVVYPVAVAATILVTFTAVNLVIVGMLPAFDRRASRWSQLATPLAISLLLTLIEIAGSGYLKKMLLTLA